MFQCPEPPDLLDLPGGWGGVLAGVRYFLKIHEGSDLAAVRMDAEGSVGGVVAIFVWAGLLGDEENLIAVNAVKQLP